MKAYQLKEKLTPSDQLFQDDAIKRDLGDDWYNFQELADDRKCNHCKKKFKTRLQYQRYCTPDCRNAELRPHE